MAHATQPDLNPADNTATQSETIPKGNGCTLTGTPGNNILVGIGHQVICGLGGNDVIHAGSYLHPGTGVPGAVIDGGTGHATCYLTAADLATSCAVIIH